MEPMGAPYEGMAPTRGLGICDNNVFRGHTLKQFKAFYLKNRNLALTGFHVPRSLDSGRVNGRHLVVPEVAARDESGDDEDADDCEDRGVHPASNAGHLGLLSTAQLSGYNMHIYTFICMYVCIYLSIYLYIYIYIYIYIYKYIY